MIGKLTRGLVIKHKVIVMITLEEKCVTVYDRDQDIDLLSNPITNPLYKLPIEVLNDTPKLLVIKQINPIKFEKISL